MPKPTLTPNWRSIVASVVMVRVEMKGLHRVRWKLASGETATYYYAWRGGPRIMAPFGTPEFNAEFLDHRNPLASLDKRKFGAWITLFAASDEFAKFADNTKRVWLPWFDHIREEFGALRTRQFDRPTIRQDIKVWRNKWKATPRAADMGKQVLSRVCSFIMAEGELSLNPCEAVPNLYEANRADQVWEQHHLDQLFAGSDKHPTSKEVIWAVKLAAHTGLRQADLLKLSWSHVKAHSIEFKTAKSRRRKTALIPITAALRVLLDEIPKRATTILTNSRGRPWKGFGSSWNKALIEARLADADLHFHDLRGTAATNFYRDDLTIREIAEILTWSEDRVEKLIDRYVKRDEILRDRIRRMEARAAFTRAD